MTATGGINLFVAYSELAQAQQTGELRAALTVSRIVVVTDTHRIVKQREQHQDDAIAGPRSLGQIEPDRNDLPPVVLTVEARPH